jgi:hypothetical protein
LTVAFSLLTVVLVGLLGVVMASAWLRLDVYIDAFGLTELRFYAAVVLVWIGFAALWLTGGVLTQARDVLLPGLAAAALVVLIAVNVLGPDGFIVRTNVDRLDDDGAFDAVYVAGLSADAVPSLVARLDELAPADRCYISQRLLEAWSKPDKDLRGFNAGRERAREAVLSQQSELGSGCANP